MKKFMERVFLGGLVLLLPASGFACSMEQWSGASGAVSVASPPTLSRVSEFCAMQATDTGWVQDNSPDAHSPFIARFYVRPQLTGSGQADLFIVYASETPATQLLKVSYDGANLNFHAGGSVLGTAAAVAGRWHLVEVEYISGGTTSFWVNTDANLVAATGSFSSATGSVEAVRLGLPTGRGGFSGGSVSYDAYESHSSTPVGSLLIGDANGTTTITIGDYAAVQKDILGTLQIGQPDCNLSGSVTIADYACVQQKILNP